MYISSQLHLETCPEHSHQRWPLISSCLNPIQMLGHCPVNPVIFWTRKCAPRLMPALSTAQLILPEFPISPYLQFFPISPTPKSSSRDLWQYETQNCNILFGHIQATAPNAISSQVLPSPISHPYFADWSLTRATNPVQVLVLMLGLWTLWNFQLNIPSLHKGKKIRTPVNILPFISSLVCLWNPNAGPRLYPDTSHSPASPINVRKTCLFLWEGWLTRFSTPALE